MGGLVCLARAYGAQTIWPDKLTRLHSALVVYSTGKKLGKSAGNAIWLDAALTSDFEFYQYFVQLPDSDVEALLQMLTNVSADEIGALAHQRQVAPHERESQRRLAQEVLSIVRGRDAVASAERATDVMYGGGASSALSPEDVAALRASNQVPTVSHPPPACFVKRITAVYTAEVYVCRDAVFAAFDQQHCEGQVEHIRFGISLACTRCLNDGQQLMSHA
jgi:tyrosyl-tRNA synthetase